MIKKKQTFGDTGIYILDISFAPKLSEHVPNKLEILFLLNNVMSVVGKA